MVYYLPRTFKWVIYLVDTSLLRIISSFPPLYPQSPSLFSTFSLTLAPRHQHLLDLPRGLYDLPTLFYTTKNFNIKNLNDISKAFSATATVK